MTYTVLARKYRPQTFADLVGQDHITRPLTNAIESDRVAHAFLFTGVRGVGKTTTARILAKALNCEQGPTPEPCNACDMCREITEGRDLDVLEIDGASNNSVEDVRRLQENLPYRPARDRMKVVIVDEVHMLSAGAFNAFLKTLEEPPPHVKFIFATTESHKVPVTIRSRCQRYDFRLMSYEVVAERVRSILAQEGIEADDSAIGIVAREAAGSMRDALTVLDQIIAVAGERLVGEEVARTLGLADRRHVLQVTAALLNGDAKTCLESVDALGAQGMDTLHFARQLLTFVRDLVVLQVAGGESPLVDLVPDERAQAREIAAASQSQELERAFAGLAKLVDEVAQSATPKIVLEMGLVRLADRPPLESIERLIAHMQALQGGGGGDATGATTRGGSSSGSRGGGSARAPRAQGAGKTAPAPEPGTARAARSRVASPSAAPDAHAAGGGEVAREPEPAPPSAGEQPRADPADPAAASASSPDTPWERIVARLRDVQPALGAIMEHGVPHTVTSEDLRVVFERGSFFGKQAQAREARELLVSAAEHVLGSRPSLEIAFSDGADAAGTSLAKADQDRRDHTRRELVDEALNHPRVKDALEIFPDSEGNVEVRVDIE